VANRERGSGSVLTVSIIGAVLCLATLGASAAAVLGGAQRIAVAADQAALAAADVASGLLPGIPCEEAARVAAAHSATLSGCSIAGQVVTVSVSGTVLGFPLDAAATAGPPGIGG
jgi:secretion/DNA translocation related TadE-like protein